MPLKEPKRKKPGKNTRTEGRFSCRRAFGDSPPFASEVVPPLVCSTRIAAHFFLLHSGESGCKQTLSPVTSSRKP